MKRLRQFVLVAMVILRAGICSAETVVVADADQDSRVLDFVDTALDLRGIPCLVTNRVVEICTSMHHWDGEQWQSSSQDFEIVDNTAVATNAPHKVTIQADINVVGAVSLVLADGGRFVTSPSFLAFRSLRTGKSALVAEVQSSWGQIVAPNQVLFTNAMDGVRCSILYINRIDGIEQNLIIEEPLDPTAYGVPDDADTRLELWTEVYAAPAGTAKVTTVGGMPDLYLDFGAAQIGSGTSFLVDGDGFSIPVGKSYGHVPDLNSTFLVEAVTYGAVKPLMDALEQQQAAMGNDTASRMARLRSRAAANPKELFARLRRPRSGTGSQARLERHPTHLGSGLVLDYSLVNGTINNWVFRSDTTYSIIGDTTLAGGSVVFEAGTVLKYASGVKLTANCPIAWRGTNFAPVVLTAADDHSVGQQLNNNQQVGASAQFASIALEVKASAANADAVLQHFRICNAKVGILLDGRTGHDLAHGQFVNCGYGVVMANSSSTLLRNALFSNVTTNLSGNTGTVRAEQVTSDGASYFRSDLAGCYLTNSLLVGVANPGTFNNSASVQTVASASGIFTTVGAGSHYLAGDTYRNQGIAAISLAGDIRRLTTYPPLTLTGDFLVPTTLAPQAQRDIDLPDLGYHYDPVDYAWTGLNLSSSLILTNGASVMHYGASGTTVGAGAVFVSEGRPEALNHVVRFNAVQEQPVAWGGGVGSSVLLQQSGGSPSTLVKLRFTEVSSLGSASAGVETLFLGGSYRGTFVAQDCLLRGVYDTAYNLDISQVMNHYLTNNILLRANVSITEGYGGFPAPVNLGFRNNLVQGGSVSLNFYAGGTGAFDLQNNLFDTVALTASGTLTHGWNAYKGTTPLSGSLGHNLTLTTLDFQTGPLGPYYYNTAPNPTSTGLLIDAGNVSSASTAAFYHYTTRVDQTKEGSTPLDIGFHYMATSSPGSTLANDYDSDGVPDYLEDLNGDGQAGAGETSWTVYNSLNGLSSPVGISTWRP